MQDIKQLLGEKFLNKFKVYHQATLFEPNWTSLKDYRCPICSNKLKFPVAKDIAYCNGKKHKTFVISKKRLNYIRLTCR